MQRGFLLRQSPAQPRPSNPESTSQTTQRCTDRGDSPNSSFNYIAKRLKQHMLAPKSNQKRQSSPLDVLKENAHPQSTVDHFADQTPKKPEQFSTIFMDKSTEKGTGHRKNQKPQEIQGKKQFWSAPRNSHQRQQRQPHPIFNFKDKPSYEPQREQITQFEPPATVSEPQQTQPQQPQFPEPNFQSVCRLFQANQPHQSLQSAVALFFEEQVQKIIGKSHTLPSPAAFSLSVPVDYSKLIDLKYKANQIIKQIIELFGQQSNQILKNRPDLAGTTSKMLIYFNEYYQQSLADLMAHFHDKLRQDVLKENNSDPQYLRDQIVTRIAEINRQTREKQQNQRLEELKEDMQWHHTQQKERFWDYMAANRPQQRGRQAQNIIYTVLNTKEKQKTIQTKQTRARKQTRGSQQTASSKMPSSSRLWLTQTGYKVISRKTKATPKVEAKTYKTLFEDALMTIVFNYAIMWCKSQKEPSIFFTEHSKEILTLQMRMDTSRAKIQERLISQIKAASKGRIRRHAQVKCSEMYRTQKQTVFEMHFAFKQVLVSLPEDYSFAVKTWNDHFVASSLKVWNQYGLIQWNEGVDLSAVDLQESLKIDNMSVTCESIALNKPAYVTFFNLPKGFSQASSQRTKEKFKRFVKRMDRVELTNIDYEAEQFTVYFHSFDRKTVQENA